MALNKLFLLSAYNTHHKHDVTCTSETYLDKSADNDVFSIAGYIVRADPHVTKRKVVYVFILKTSKIVTSYCSECIFCEISATNIIGHIAIIYCSPSQRVSESDSFLENFKKPFIIIIII